MNIFYIKLFLETSVEAECESALEQVLSLLPKSISEKDRNIQKYWKIPEYMQIELVGETIEIDQTAFKSICELLGSNWEFTYSHEDMEAIWNPLDDNYFNIDCVRWALVSFN